MLPVIAAKVHDAFLVPLASKSCVFGVLDVVFCLFVFFLKGIPDTKHIYRLSWDYDFFFFFETGKIALESSPKVVLQFFMQLFPWANILLNTQAIPETKGQSANPTVSETLQPAVEIRAFFTGNF